MQVLLLLLAIGACLSTGQEWVAPTLTSPLLLWSNQNYFSMNQQQVDLLTTKNAQNLIFDAVKQNPEVILIFIEPELRTEQVSILTDAYKTQATGGAFPNIKNFIENSAGSLVAPYVSVSENDDTIGSSIVNSLVKATLSKESKIFVAREQGSTDKLSYLNSLAKVSTYSVAELESLLQNKNLNIFNNGITDLIVVLFDAPAVHINDNEVKQHYTADDFVVGSVTSAVLRNCESYLAIFTADKPLAKLTYSLPTTHKRLQSFEARNVQADESDGDSLFPQAISEALLVMVPFLLILSIGITCTFGIQSDLKFDAEKPKKF